MAEEKLVVEVAAAHNLMPKDGQGSSSAFVEIEFEHQRQRTSVKHKDLNPVWNERLVFPIANPADLPYRAIEVAVYNEQSSASSRNFLGRVRFTGAGVPAPGEDSVPQLFALEKRSPFSHIRGDITLKVYRVLAGDETASKAKDLALKPQQKQKQQPPASQIQQQQNQKGKQNQNQNQNNSQKQAQNQAGNGPGPTDFKPVVPAGAPPSRRHEGFPGGAAMWPAPNLGNREEFSLKETNPLLGERPCPSYTLVEQMKYLYVRVVKARSVSHGGGAAPHVEVKLGNYRGLTKVSANLVWNQVFAFSSDCIQSSAVEIFLKEKEGRDEFLGFVGFDMAEVPRRVPPDSPLAPQWYRMENRREKSFAGELMLAVWFGTQADECFSEAWHSSSAGVQGDGLSSIKSKVYLSPKLWYLRVAVIEAQDLVPGEKLAAMATRYPELRVRVQIGDQKSTTNAARSTPGRPLSSPIWNENLIFVVAEPFEDHLAVAVEDRGEAIGHVFIPLSAVEQRSGEKPVSSRWFSLEGPNQGRFSSRLHLRLSLDGGYHVLEESSTYASDLRPTAKHLWEPSIGVLEIGIIGATDLIPVKTKDGRGAADAFCVAKYGPKWVRTRTVVDSLSPKWNEQYQWEVFDPSTVVTVGVFDNARLGGGSSRDSRLGKVRIRLSTLESDRLYTHAYPLIMLQPYGVRKMGELHLAVRFSCSNPAAMLHLYLRPPFPRMHYLEPISPQNLEYLRFRACEVVAARLGRAEPPLAREIVEYMLDRGSNLWSARRSKAHFYRIQAVFSLPLSLLCWIEAARTWQHPANSLILAAAFLSAVAFPDLVLPSLFLAVALLGIWRFRRRPRQPPFMDLGVSQAETVKLDELEEEFDVFPTCQTNPDLLRMRYDRLRAIGMHLQSTLGNFATQCERCQALIGWRDPRATLLFLIFCLGAAALFYFMPARLVVALWGIHALLPPKFRSRLPSPFMNFFRRLPSQVDSLL